MLQQKLLQRYRQTPLVLWHPKQCHGHLLFKSSIERHGYETATLVCPASSWRVPEALVAEMKVENGKEHVRSDSLQTIYTVRVTTTLSRGSAISTQHSAVNICLIGKKGKALIYRMAAVNDPNTTAALVEQFCKVVDEISVGADCAAAHATAFSWSPGIDPLPITSRFQEGRVDEVSFLAEDLGPLEAILIAPESGTWGCEEVDVSSSRSGHMDRFVCRQKLGDDLDSLAAYLSPVPNDCIVYGSGDNAKVITKEEASSLRSFNMSEYAAFKNRIMSTSAIFTIGGTGITGLVGGPSVALPFALGGVAGLAYQWVLQQKVDGIVADKIAAQQYSDALKGQPSMMNLQDTQSSTSASALQLPQPLKQLLNSSLFRTVFIAGLLLYVGHSSDSGHTLQATASSTDTWSTSPLTHALFAVMGFLSYKLALITVSLSPPDITRDSIVNSKVKNWSEFHKD